MGRLNMNKYYQYLDEQAIDCRQVTEVTSTYKPYKKRTVSLNNIPDMELPDERKSNYPDTYKPKFKI